MRSPPPAQIVIGGYTADGEPWCTAVLSNQPVEGIDGLDDCEDGVLFPFNHDLVGGTWFALVVRAVLPGTTRKAQWEGVDPADVPGVFHPFLRSCGAIRPQKPDREA